MYRGETYIYQSTALRVMRDTKWRNPIESARRDISSLVASSHTTHDVDKDAPSRQTSQPMPPPPPNNTATTKGGKVGLAKVSWGGKNRGHQREQRRQHSSKTFTIDSDGDEDDENDYEDSDDDDGRGNDDNDNNNNQKRKKSSKHALNNVARAYQHEKKKKKKFYYYAQQRYEFSVCRFLLVAIAITFALIFLVEQFAPKDVYIHRSIENGRNKAKVKVKEHARRAREAFRAYTSYDFEKANTQKYEENLREEYALAAMVANSRPSGEESSRASERSGGVIGENVFENANEKPFNPKAHFGGGGVEEEDTKSEDESSAAALNEEGGDSSVDDGDDLFLQARLTAAEASLVRERSNYEIPDAPSPPPPPPSQPSPPPLSHHLSTSCRQNLLKDAQIDFFSKNYCKFDSATVETVNPFERKVKGQSMSMRTLPEVLLATYFQALSNSEIGIRARRAAIGKERLRRPGLLEPTEKLKSRELTDPVQMSSEDGEIESGVNGGGEFIGGESSLNRRMLLSKKHLEDVKKQKESDAKKKSFKDREKKRKKEHVEKINTSPPPPPQPPFIEFEYRGPKSPNWMNETTGQSKYAPYFSATFLGASLGPFAHVAKRLMNAAHLSGVVRVWEGNSNVFTALEQNWAQKDQNLHLSREDNVVAALVNAHVWGEKAGNIKSANDLFVKRRSAFGKHTIEPAVSLQYALSVSNLYHGENVEIPTVFAFDGDVFFKDLRPKLRDAMNSAFVKAVSFTATSFDKAAAFSREFPEFLVYVAGAGNGGSNAIKANTIDEEKVDAEFNANQNEDISDSLGAGLFTAVKPSFLLIDDYTYSPALEEIFKQTKSKTRTLAMLAVRKNDPFHEMIKENGFLSCTCDGQCKSTPEVVFNNDGVCAPVEVKKEKKSFVAKLLGGSKAPEKFGDVDAGVGTVIEDWDE